MGVIDASVERLVAEFNRRGSLTVDRVNAICDRRGLDGVETARVRQRLAELGLLGEVPAARRAGFGGAESVAVGVDQAPELTFDDDLLGIYLREIGRYSLLTAEDERALGRRIKTAQELAESLNGQEPSHGEAVILEDGERARTQLYEANLRLVVSFAKSVPRGPKLDMLDVIQEGNTGLATAVDKFDYELGYKFSTYATWWIRQSMSRGVANTGRTIRLPNHMIDRIKQLQRMQIELTRQLGREPTLVELADQADLDPAAVQFALDVSAHTASLDAPVGEGDATVGDLVVDPNAIDPGQVIASISVVDEVDEVLAGLDDRDRRIMVLRYGLDGDAPRTLEQVGEEFGVTRERIRQLQKKIEEDLARSARLRSLVEEVPPPPRPQQSASGRDDRSRSRRREVLEAEIRAELDAGERVG